MAISIWWRKAISWWVIQFFALWGRLQVVTATNEHAAPSAWVTTFVTMRLVGSSLSLSNLNLSQIGEGLQTEYIQTDCQHVLIRVSLRWLVQNICSIKYWTTQTWAANVWQYMFCFLLHITRVSCYKMKLSGLHEIIVFNTATLDKSTPSFFAQL